MTKHFYALIYCVDDEDENAEEPDSVKDALDHVIENLGAHTIKHDNFSGGGHE
jgi:hypothetical protein